MREVMNRLPTAVLLSQEAMDRQENDKHLPLNEHVRSLAHLRSNFPDMDLTQDAENIPVPREVALIFERLIAAAVLEDQRRIGALAAFLTDDSNTKSPAVREWRDLSRYFTRWAHLPDEPDATDDLPTDDELIQRIRVFEDHLDNMRMAFFESKSTIEDLLAAANEVTDEVE
jgi:hypothetical protein